MGQIGLFNRDSSFFEVKCDKISEDITKDVISFSFEEEREKMNSGSVVLNDPNAYYASLFKVGMPLIVSWGYKQNPIFLSLPVDSNEMYGEYRRKNVHCICQFPSGGASENGAMTFNLNFISSEYQNGQFNKTYKNGTKFTVIKEALTTFLGKDAVTATMFIKFSRQNEIAAGNTAVMQTEGYFKFLCRLAFEWRAVFRIAHDSAGLLLVLFADYGSTEMKEFMKRSAQAISGQSITLDYKYHSNPSTTLVRSYTWSQQGGGSGDNVQITVGADGTPQFRRYVTTTEGTLVYKFHPELMEAALKKTNNPAEQAKMTLDWVTTATFQEALKSGFFTIEHDTTAPQGVGMSIQCKTLGNPMLTVPMRVNFGESQGAIGVDHSSSGFPNMFSNDQISFWIQKVTHSISTSGYECDIDIVDAFTITGGALI